MSMYPINKQKNIHIGEPYSAFTQILDAYSLLKIEF